MSDKIDFLGEQLGHALTSLNKVICNASFQYWVAIAIFTSALLIAACIVLRAHRVRRDIYAGLQIIVKHKDATTFSRHFDATSRRLETIASLRTAWLRFVATRIATKQQGADTPLLFAAHPSHVFTLTAIVPDWRSIAMLPKSILSIALFSALICLLGILTELFGTSFESAAHKSGTVPFVSQHLAQVGRSSFAIVAAGLLGWSATFLASRACRANVVRALAEFTDALQQHTVVRSREDLLLQELSAGTGKTVISGIEATDIDQLRESLGSIQNRVAASALELEAVLRREINSSTQKALESIAQTAAQSLMPSVGSPVGGRLEPNALLPFVNQLTKLRDDISIPISEAIRKLQDSIKSEISVPLNAIANDLTPLTHDIADVRRYVANSQDNLDLASGSLVEPISRLQAVQSSLIGTASTMHREILTAIAGLRQKDDQDALAIMSSTSESVAKAMHEVRDQVREVKEAIARWGSEHINASGQIDSRLRTELAALRLAVQSESRERELLQTQSMEGLRSALEVQIQEHVAQPIAVVSGAVAEVTEALEHSMSQLAALSLSVSSSSTDLGGALSIRLEELAVTIGMLSRDIQSSTDNQSNSSKLVDEAKQVLDELREVAEQVQESSAKAVSTLAAAASSVPSAWHQELTLAIRSIQTAGEVARVKLEDKLSKIIESAAHELSRAAKSTLHEAASLQFDHTKKLDDLRAQITVAVSELSLVTSQLSAVDRLSTADVRAIVESAKVQLNDASSELHRAVQIASGHARDTLEQQFEQAKSEQAQLKGRFRELTEQLIRDLRSATNPPDKPTRMQHTIAFQQPARDAEPLSPDRLDETLTALSEDLRKVYATMSEDTEGLANPPKPNVPGLRFGASRTIRSPLTFPHGTTVAENGAQAELTTQIADREPEKQSSNIEDVINQIFGGHRVGGHPRQ